MDEITLLILCLLIAVPIIPWAAEWIRHFVDRFYIWRSIQQLNIVRAEVEQIQAELRAYRANMSAANKSAANKNHNIRPWTIQLDTELRDKPITEQVKTISIEGALWRTQKDQSQQASHLSLQQMDDLEFQAERVLKGVEIAKQWRRQGKYVDTIFEASVMLDTNRPCAQIVIISSYPQSCVKWDDNCSDLPWAICCNSYPLQRFDHM